MKLEQKMFQYYVSKLSRPELEKMALECISLVQDMSIHFRQTSDKLGELLSEYEIDYVINEVKDLFNKKKLKKISTSWLQRHYKIGYARAARYIDVLAEKKVIRPTESTAVWLEY